MSQSPAQGPPFPSELAFVVQFRAEAALTQGRCDGRVEHVVSGQAALFTRWAELEAFITQVLAVVERPH